MEKKIILSRENWDNLNAVIYNNIRINKVNNKEFFNEVLTLINQVVKNEYDYTIFKLMNRNQVGKLIHVIKNNQGTSKELLFLVKERILFYER